MSNNISNGHTHGVYEMISSAATLHRNRLQQAVRTRDNNVET